MRTLKAAFILSAVSILAICGVILPSPAQANPTPAQEQTMVARHWHGAYYGHGWGGGYGYNRGYYYGAYPYYGGYYYGGGYPAYYGSPYSNYGAPYYNSNNGLYFYIR